MNSVTLVRDIMTTDVVSTTPETSVLDVAKIFNEKRFNGIPVIDADKKVVGLVTEYNLISTESLLHLPMLEKIVKNPSGASKDMEYLADQLHKTAALTVKDVMEKDPIVLLYSDTFEHALEVLHQHHRVNPILVVDEQKRLVGVVSRYDLLKLLKLFGHN